MYIAAVKPSRHFLAIAVLTLSLHGADEQSVTVKTISVKNSAVVVNIDLQGKPTELECQISSHSCSQPQPGEYSMRPATADDGIYEDCTNVVLLKSSGARKEKIGVYCWLNAPDCYLACPSENHVETIPAVVPDVALEGSPQVQFGPRTDFEKEYPRPTITDVGLFDLMLGRPPKVHIIIQYGATEFVGSSNSEAEVKANGLKVGASVEMREQGKYLKIRGPGQRKWVKLKLISKSELHNL